MTEDLIATGREAGFCITDSLETIVGNKTALEAYTALVVARTREECAKLCMARANDLAKAMLMNPNHLGRPAGSFDHGCMLEAESLAAAIRALGERT